VNSLSSYSLRYDLIATLGDCGSICVFRIIILCEKNQLNVYCQEIGLSLYDHVCELNKQTGEVLFNGNVIVLRPKTFELLLLLASQPQAVFSKPEMLASVWQGAVVEDQVIFQSINEIRKEFGLPEVIKTYPRRGYSWEISTTVIEESKINANKVISPSNVAIKHRTVFLTLLISVAITLSILTFFILNNTNDTVQSKRQSEHSLPSATSPLAHEGIVVLPFNVSSLGDSQQWLRFGAMEGLIKKLSPNKGVTVFHLEDVIEILNRIPIGERDDVEQIFEKSGASIILQTSISGFPGELNVIYTVFSRTNRVTKTLIAQNLEGVLVTLAKLFEQSIDENLVITPEVFDTQLQNQLIIKAIQFLEVDDQTSALAFIQSAVVNEPNNIIALYFLAKTTLSMGKADESLTATESALVLTENKNYHEYRPRLLYFKGLSLASLGHLANAEISLLKSAKFAKMNKDWLYYAYVQSILGMLNQAKNKNDLAFEYFYAALEYQEILGCPMGVAQGHLDFADFYLHQGDKSSAQQSFKQAQALVSEKNLKQMFVLITEMQQRLK